MEHSYKAGDRVTIFQMKGNKLIIEGPATIRKLVPDVDEQYVVEFDNERGETYERFVDSWGQSNPEKYVRDFNKRIA